VNDEILIKLITIQQSIRDLALKDGRWKIGKYISIEELMSIAEGMVKSNEKIGQRVIGNFTIESSFGNYEIVKGLLVATNYRVLVVFEGPLRSIRKDSFTYPQINTVTMTPDQESLSLIMQDEVITLFDLSEVDPYQEPEKFHKYIIDKKNASIQNYDRGAQCRNCSAAQKLIKVQQNFFRKIWEQFFKYISAKKKGMPKKTDI
jgi:hypothetical protein